MLRTEEETTFVGVSELRKEVPNLLSELQRNKVILTRRNKPVGVIIKYEEYERLQNLIELLEDMTLGYTVLSRAKRKKRRLITLEQAERKVGLK